MTTTFVLDKDGNPVTIKDPDSILAYAVNWATFLDGETISSAIVTGTGVAVDSSSNTTTVTNAVISGGRVGETAKVRFQVTTNSGKVAEQTLFFKIQQK